MEGDDCNEEIQKCEDWKECEKYEKSIDYSSIMKCANGLQCLANGLSSEKLTEGKCFRTGEILYMKRLPDAEFIQTIQNDTILRKDSSLFCIDWKLEHKHKECGEIERLPKILNKTLNDCANHCREDNSKKFLYGMNADEGGMSCVCVKDCFVQASDRGYSMYKYDPGND